MKAERDMWGKEKHRQMYLVLLACLCREHLYGGRQDSLFYTEGSQIALDTPIKVSILCSLECDIVTREKQTFSTQLASEDDLSHWYHVKGRPVFRLTLETLLHSYS